MEVKLYQSLAQLEPKHWDYAKRSVEGLDYDFLATVERSKINALKHNYALFFDEPGNTCGRANFYQVEMDFTTMDKDMSDEVKASIKSWFPNFMNFQVYEMGMFTMIGDSLDVASEEYLVPCLEQVAVHMDHYIRDQGADLLLMRDVPYDKADLYQRTLEDHGFVMCSGFTNAVLPLSWNSFDEYLASLNSKDRHKLKTSLKVEQKFGIEIEIKRDYEELAGELEMLWNKVNAKAKDYSREKLTKAFFEQSAKNLAQSSELICFRYEGKLVAFMYNVFSGDDYTMLDWGIDYDFALYNQTSLYRTASVLSLKRAIELGKKNFEMGITNYVPKKLLGAKMRPLVYFVKHKDGLRQTKAMARLLTESIDHPEVLHVNDCGQEFEYNADEWRAYIADRQISLSENDIFSDADKEYKKELLRIGGIYGFYPEFHSPQASSIISADGRKVTLLGTNSYLGLNSHPRVVAACMQATRAYGTGCSGSPLLNGTLDLHNQLEAELAEFVNKESAMLCSTGYQTNLAAISALCDSDTLVIMDERNHRSLYDGVRLSGADIAMFRHRDLAHAERILRRNRHRSCLWVTDSVFSMEGSVADLKTMCKLKESYGCRLFVDESHAIGVLGNGGRGVAEAQGVLDRVDIIMGTFSKSLASLGGFVAASADVIDYIKHKAGGHIFSASMPAGVVASVRAALNIIQEEPERRVQLQQKSAYFAEQLERLGYNINFDSTPIIQLILGDETLALAAYKKFYEEGVFVNPVIPPAVPASECGFRISFMSTHEWEDLYRALEVFERLRNDLVLDENATGVQHASERPGNHQAVFEVASEPEGELTLCG
ncbi:aminotransferase class I/II-fold pyridoxal phosphate-dependent enzyme [Agaribacterium haliotis]|uniref:aminotransferase class I/II-fold pyridoxal phosphate-dependent enzyme n=1 Tax=Agaribacterium haliotis TaxID=2013869 RepID=UPI00195859ED|nr:aminotransferase class I/II-fold pyridoxal phosphate-dependent enzyme [Agaribacterium haliotis]